MFKKTTILILFILFVTFCSCVKAEENLEIIDINGGDTYSGSTKSIYATTYIEADCTLAYSKNSDTSDGTTILGDIVQFATTTNDGKYYYWFQLTNLDDSSTYYYKIMCTAGSQSDISDIKKIISEKPDLSIKDIYIEDDLVKVNYCNDGNDPVNVNSFGIETFYIKISANGKIHTGTSGNSNYVFSVPGAGECTYTDGIPANYFNLIKGNQYLISATADHLSEVDESNENNNTLTKSIIFSNNTLTISNVNTNSVTSNSANITWSTNIDSNSYIWYGLENTIDGRNFLVKDYDNYSKEHNLKLTNLLPNTTYYYRASSKDKNDKIAESADYSFTTKSSDNIPDLIIKELGVKYFNAANSGNYYYTVVKNNGNNFVFSNDVKLGVRFEGSTGWLGASDEAAYYTEIKYTQGDKISSNQEIEIIGPSTNQASPGTYTIKALVDTANLINESNENNNTLTKSIAIGNNTLNISVNDNYITSDNKAAIYWNTNLLANCGIDYSTNSDVSTGVGTNGHIIQYATDTNDGRYYYVVNLNSLQPNTDYYYMVNCDYGGETASSEVNTLKTYSSDTKVDAAITKIFPTEGTAGTQITIYGNNLGSACVGYSSVECQAGVYIGDTYIPRTSTNLLSWDNGKINITIPESTKSGIVRVYRNEIIDYGTANASNRMLDIKGAYLKVLSQDNDIIKIDNKANLLNNNKFDEILAELKELRDIVKEQQTQIKYLTSLKKDVKALSEKVENALNNFITYGVDENTKKLGAGERAAVIYSYKSAFNKLPETEEELSDAIKIANGRWPSITNDNAEKKAKEQFQKIYKRIADMNNASDNAAVTVMAYGLRQKAENRNLDSEEQGINTFRNIYGHLPTSTEDWNIMQAITYSGASRGVDTDGDLLTDAREAELGTNPNNKDTDGDGFIDGIEVANGYNPLGE
ncbi:MAG: fibronectin type III domain-containing protein [Patescibacteria group bacterium]